MYPQILMRVGDGEQQLYMSVLLDLLRSYQRKGKKPNFPDFKKEVRVHRRARHSVEAYTFGVLVCS